MGKSSLSALCIIMLQACTHGESIKLNSSDINRGYFADASECSHAAMRMEEIKAPTAGSMSVVEIPTTYDAGKFVVCMKYAGRPASRANLPEYLDVSQACLHEARGAKNPDEGYADCIRRSRLNVEIIEEK